MSKATTDIRYDSLREVLESAYNQAAIGKGRERHANDKPFDEQPILVIARLLDGHPAASVLFQAMKKIVESARLGDRATDELRGAIVYISAAIILMEE